MADTASDEVFERVRDEYMPGIYDEIRQLAQRKSGGPELRPLDVFRAFEEYFAGLPRGGGAGQALSGFIHEHIFLLSALFLTITFGLFGLYHGEEDEVSSFLDIAKIFAGAVVGGAAGSTVASMTRRRSGGQPGR
jgi:hypothetical protein